MARQRRDLNGMRFGKLVVLGLNEEESNKLRKRGSKMQRCTYWNCLCDCGKTVIVRGTNLTKDNPTSSCRHCNNIRIGDRFGRLTVISLNEEESNKLRKCGNGIQRRIHWLCKCDCGTEIVVREDSLKSGVTKSCGCLRKEIMNNKIGENHPNWQGGITDITDWLRVLPCIYEWKDKAREEVDFICQLSNKRGGGNLPVHHLYGFNLIIKDAHSINNIEIKRAIGEYSQEELSKLVKYVEEWHKDTSNAVVLHEEVHVIFHTIYGSGDNTPEQFEEFKERYLNGEFDDLIDLNK